jgi:hypothetical protein
MEFHGRSPVGQIGPSWIIPVEMNVTRKLSKIGLGGVGYGGILESTPGSSFLKLVSTIPSWRLTINKPWIALEWDHHL